MDAKELEQRFRNIEAQLSQPIKGVSEISGLLDDLFNRFQIDRNDSVEVKGFFEDLTNSLVNYPVLLQKYNEIAQVLKTVNEIITTPEDRPVGVVILNDLLQPGDTIVTVSSQYKWDNIIGLTATQKHQVRLYGAYIQKKIIA